MPSQFKILPLTGDFIFHFKIHFTAPAANSLSDQFQMILTLFFPYFYENTQPQIITKQTDKKKPNFQLTFVISLHLRNLQTGLRNEISLNVASPHFPITAPYHPQGRPVAVQWCKASSRPWQAGSLCFPRYFQ